VVEEIPDAVELTELFLVKAAAASGENRVKKRLNGARRYLPYWRKAERSRARAYRPPIRVDPFESSAGWLPYGDGGVKRGRQNNARPRDQYPPAPSGIRACVVMSLL